MEGREGAWVGGGWAEKTKVVCKKEKSMFSKVSLWGVMRMGAMAVLDVRAALLSL